MFVYIFFDRTKIYYNWIKYSFNLSSIFELCWNVNLHIILNTSEVLTIYHILDSIKTNRLNPSKLWLFNKSYQNGSIKPCKSKKLNMVRHFRQVVLEKFYWLSKAKTFILDKNRRCRTRHRPVCMNRFTWNLTYTHLRLLRRVSDKNWCSKPYMY